MVDNDLEDNGIKMHSTHDEEKSSVGENLIATLQNKIYMYITWIFKNVYIDKLEDILNTTLDMKSFYVKSSRHIDFH